MKDLIGYLAVLGAVILWGLSYIVMKSATTDYPQLLFQFWRYTAVVLLYGAMFYRSLRAIPGSLWRIGLLRLGFANFVLGFFSIYAVQSTTPTRVVVINSFIIGAVPLLRWIQLRARPSRPEAWAIAIAIGAIALLLGPEEAGVRLGDGLAFIGMIGYAYAIVLTDRMLAEHRASVIQVSFLGIAGCALFFAAAAAVYAGFFTSVTEIPSLMAQPGTLAGIVYMVVLVSLAANLLAVLGQRRLPPVTVSLLFCLEPAVTALLDYAILGHVPTMRVLLCGVLLTGATLVAAMPARPRSKEAGGGVSAGGGL